jgi:hypothetical protein
LFQLISLSAGQLQSILRDVNENHWADYIVNTGQLFVEFSKDVRLAEWA